MIAAFDVQYAKDGKKATAAAVVFDTFSDSKSTTSYTTVVRVQDQYVPGEFYRRELPCILAVLEKILEPIHLMIVDGYVHFGGHPGLGSHLRDQIGDHVAVIGVAKSEFKGSSAQVVYRGASKTPLFVTAAGIDVNEAARHIVSMHGVSRIPTLLKEVDRLSRMGVHRTREAE